MSKTTAIKPLALAMGAAFVTSLAGASVANAAENPFGMTELSSGYMVSEGGMKEGKCGASHMKKKEGKCGGNMSSMPKEKMKEGKCGGAKADKMKQEGMGNMSMDKMKEGKCGGSMKKTDSANKKMMKEGKCGEGKCGSSMKKK